MVVVRVLVRGRGETRWCVLGVDAVAEEAWGSWWCYKADGDNRWERSISCQHRMASLRVNSFWKNEKIQDQVPLRSVE